MSKRDREDELCDILEICNVKKKNKLDNEGIERFLMYVEIIIRMN